MVNDGWNALIFAGEQGEFDVEKLFLLHPRTNPNSIVMYDYYLVYTAIVAV